jgi:hypothetical protein
MFSNYASRWERRLVRSLLPFPPSVPRLASCAMRVSALFKSDGGYWILLRFHLVLAGTSPSEFPPPQGLRLAPTCTRCNAARTGLGRTCRGRATLYAPLGFGLRLSRFPREATSGPAREGYTTGYSRMQPMGATRLRVRGSNGQYFGSDENPFAGCLRLHSVV